MVPPTATDLPQLLRMKLKASTVGAFVKSVLHSVIPQPLFGSRGVERLLRLSAPPPPLLTDIVLAGTDNRKRLFSKIDQFLKLRKNESMAVHEVCVRVCVDGLLSSTLVDTSQLVLPATSS